MTVPESVTPDRPVIWVVGGSGLLGSAVRRRAALDGHPVLTSPIPWEDPERAVEALLATATSLPAGGWWLAWCAGGAVVASGEDQIGRELQVLREFLARWQPAEVSAGAIFFASSGGAVYAGSSGPPFTEDTVPVPLAPYGHGKLQAEALFTDFAKRTSVPLLIGRISNLYGPGQNLSKGQGLVSLLCQAHLTGKPLSIFVSHDTKRDYLYVDDAAEMVIEGLGAIARAEGVYVKILASGRSVTVAELIGELRRINRVLPPVVSGRSPVTRFQVSDLRMHSVAWPPLEGCARTPLGVGIASCMAAVEASLRCPQEGRV
jgi:UDP-glucose 4-epimerase